MAWSADAKKNLKKWAASGARIDPESLASYNNSRAAGFPPSYGQSGGDYPELEVFNQLFGEFSDGVGGAIQWGTGEWDNEVNYPRGATVIYDDGDGYRSFVAIAPSGPESGGAKAPRTDLTKWRAASHLAHPVRGPTGSLATGGALDVLENNSRIVRLNNPILQYQTFVFIVDNDVRDLTKPAAAVASDVWSTHIIPRTAVVPEYSDYPAKTVNQYRVNFVTPAGDWYGVVRLPGIVDPNDASKFVAGRDDELKVWFHPKTARATQNPPRTQESLFLYAI